ncbi:MAG: hypothetical protein AABX54_03250 [Nanoarchaeota archaeon]
MENENVPEGLVSSFAELYKRYPHIAIGEHHSSRRLHILVSKLITSLIKKGLKSVCLEIHSDLQEVINHYIQTGEESFLAYLTSDNQRLIEQGYPFTGRGDNYFDILRLVRGCREQYSEVNIVALKKNIQNVPENDINMAELDKFMAERIPDSGPTLVYAGEMHLRKDFAIPKFKAGIYSIATIPNPFTTNEEHNPGIDDIIRRLMDLGEIPKESSLIDFHTKRGASLGKLLKRNHFKYSDWFDGLLVYA